MRHEVNDLNNEDGHDGAGDAKSKKGDNCKQTGKDADEARVVVVVSGGDIVFAWEEEHHDGEDYNQTAGGDTDAVKDKCCVQCCIECVDAVGE